MSGVGLSVSVSSCPQFLACAGGGVWEAYAGEATGDWIRLGSSLRSCWSCVSMSGVGLSVSVSSWGPSGSEGSRLVADVGVGVSNCGGWSLCLAG